jgi:RNA polymerase sigma-70 factor (ECF subfamily)
MSLSASDPDRATDSELLNAIARGDRRAMQRLYLEYQRPLTRFLWRFTQRQETIEEIVNDTFMVVWRKAREFRWESRVSSWIFGIAHRKALKSIHKHRREAAGRVGKGYEETVNPVLETETRDWLASGLSLLPVEQRLALELACHMGHSLKEVAVITGTPVGTVKTRLFYARRRLRQYLPTVGGSSPEESGARLAMSTKSMLRKSRAASLLRAKRAPCGGARPTWRTHGT